MLFITGTDTDVGKTVITGLIAKQYYNEKKSVITQKWVQTGTEDYPFDLDTHQEISQIPQQLYAENKEHCCPYQFKLASSPHLAAQKENRYIEPKVIVDSYQKLKQKFEIVLVEGSGGPLMPLNEKLTTLDLIEELQLEVVIVIANKLGAINHTLLTINALQQRGLKIKGLIFNNYMENENNIIQKDNIEIIQTFSTCDILGIVPKLDSYHDFHDKIIL